MTTDMENELRELFREKAGEAPIATPAAATQRVLRRGRRRQVGTVLGSAAVALLLIVGSVAGLQRILGDGPDTFETGEYEVFERTATIEAFTVTSPSDWFLVNHWPASRRSPFATSALCPEGNPTTNTDCIRPTDPARLDPSLGLPMFQLTNEDVGLGSSACEEAPGPGMAVLYVALDYESDTAGVYPPYLPPPSERGLPAEGDGPCGPGRYASFSVAGQPFFAWIWIGSGASDEDRASVMSAFRSMKVADSWTPRLFAPGATTPGYVIAGGVSESGGDWRLEVRPGDTDVALTLFRGDGNGTTGSFTVPTRPIEWTGTDPMFGAITRAATGVEFRPGTENENYDLGGSPVPGVILPVPPSLGSFDFDLFFLDPPAGYGELGGRVIALGLESASPAPPEIAEPRARTVELSGSFAGQEWSARFRGAFTGPGSPCVEVTIEGRPPGHLCPDPVHSTLAGPSPYLIGSLSSELYLLVGSVPPEIVQIRFDGDDDAIVPQEFRCEMGPLGWTDPDRKVCAIALPPKGSGTLQYLDANGAVLFDEGHGWSQATAASPAFVDPVHGGTYWAVYPWVGAAGSREADDVSAQLLAEFGIEAGPGDLSCDQGAAEALGTDAEQGIAVYFETEDEANAFALLAGLLGHEAGPVIAQVTTYCLD